MIYINLRGGWFATGTAIYICSFGPSDALQSILCLPLAVSFAKTRRTVGPGNGIGAPHGSTPDTAHFGGKLRPLYAGNHEKHDDEQ